MIPFSYFYLFVMTNIRGGVDFLSIIEYAKCLFNVSLSNQEANFVLTLTYNTRLAMTQNNGDSLSNILQDDLHEQLNKLADLIKNHPQFKSLRKSKHHNPNTPK